MNTTDVMQGFAKHKAVNGLILSSFSVIVTRQTILIPISIVLEDIIQLTFLLSRFIPLTPSFRWLRVSL